MVDTFEIIEKPEICQFSENLGKMIIRNKNSSLTCVYMTVRLDDATICDKLTLYYDAESLITINLRDIVHTLLECVNAGDVWDMIVNGRVLMKDREVLSLDEERILYESRKYMESLDV